MKRIILYIIFVFLFSQNLSAQEDCGWSALKNASEDYNYGNFEGVIQIINKCIYTGFDEKQQVEGFRLLAKTFLAIDNDSSASVAVGELLKINPKFQPDYLSDPPRFIEILERFIRRNNAQVVVSVSKKEENVSEAPATVILLSAKEFKRRGYNDYEQVLHDMPGFDISRSNGNLYTHAYQRGYRSINTNRTLFLVDGVEENDLWSSNVYLSRQYSVSDLKGIELVYGPASTMYGSNAFLGVINIIHNQPQDMVKHGKSFGANIIGGYGTYNTKFIDGTVAFANKNRKIALSLTSRVFYSDEQDLSSYPEHDYEPMSLTPELIDRYHASLDITDNIEVADFLTANPTSGTYYSLNGSNQIILTPEGIQKALDYDNNFYDKVDFSDKTESFYINAKVKIHDLSVGYTYWNKSEGPGAQYNDLMFASYNAGQSWRPIHQYLYVNYEKEVSDKIKLSNYITYKIHEFDNNNAIVRFRKSYLNSAFDLYNLIDGDIPTFDTIYLFQKSNQIREEIKFIYDPNPRISILSGFETRFSAIQGDYSSSKTNDAEETGNPSTNIPGGNFFFSTDFGFYIQSEIKLAKKLILTTGIRYDNNKIRLNGGYGNSINPRISLVYFSEKFKFKAIYAEAFKDATNREKFSTAAGKRELSNPLLEPEKVKNLELLIGKDYKDKLNLNISMYRSIYSNIIQEVKVLREDGTYTNQNQAKGKALVYGINAFSDINFDKLSFYVNYTFTMPYELNPVDSENIPITDSLGNPYSKLRISDIATHSANFGVNYEMNKNWNFNLRTNFVGNKQTGEGTTVPTNTSEFDPYFLLNSTISWSLPKFNFQFQLIVNNILNTEYFSPGLDYASNELSSQLVQNGRYFLVNFTFSLQKD